MSLRDQLKKNTEPEQATVSAGNGGRIVVSDIPLRLQFDRGTLWGSKMKIECDTFDEFIDILSEWEEALDTRRGKDSSSYRGGYKGDRGGRR